MERNYAQNLIPKKSKTNISETKNNSQIILNMQRYLLNFWSTRDELNPQGAWEKYLKEVK